MTFDRFQQAGELLCEALEIDSEQRTAFLKKACSGDDALLSEVESLLIAHFQAGEFIQTPPGENVYDLLSNDEERLKTGERIGFYKVVREIGRGGMGAVYLAERADEQYKKYVAIKLLKRGMDTDDLLRHFRRERQILATFDHPNIARLHDGGSTETGRPYFVMEFVEGKPIDDYCNEHQLNITQRLELFQHICSAVSYAHRNLVVHRDIKPSNIFVTSEGVPKLLDFGIAKILQTEEPGLTATGIRWMTPEFASPEQALGHPVTTASDVYSLGVVLYELLTGYPPYQFTGRTPVEIARVIVETQPHLPSVVINTVEISPQNAKLLRTTHEGSLERLRRRLQGDLDNIVLMAMRKEPERRYQSVEQFSEDIRRHLEGLPVIARKDTFTYRASKFMQRNKVTVASFIFAILAFVISATVAGIIQWKANQQAKFLQEFGAEAARIEGIMRFAYLMPLHDISPEREIVMRRMRAITARMAELGSSAQGPGHYAIGRGFMALQQYEDARKHFEQALNNYGYKTSEVAYSYGLTLAMLFQTELQAAARIGSKELRETRMKEIQRDYKDPSLRFIREGRGSTEYSEYAEAMVEFLDEHYEKAIQKSEKAMQQIPWLYESKRLEGEAYRTIGMQLYNKGDHSKALDAYRNADQAFELSIQKADSDPLGYLGRCNLKYNLLRVQRVTGIKADNTYDMGKGLCQKALEADPKNAGAYLALSYLHIAWAEDYSIRKMTERRPVLELAVQAAQKAILLQPESSEMHKALGMAYHSLAYEFYLHDVDPSKAVAAGGESFKKAIQLNPNDGVSYLFRGWSIWYLAEYLRVTGADPRKILDEAHQSIQTAIRLNPKDYGSYHAAGSIFYSKAAYEAEVGLDPLHSLDSALQLYQKSMALNPGYLNASVWFGWTALTKGEYLSLVGRNPQDVLNQAEKTYQDTLRINPNLSDLFRGLGQSNWIKGEYAVQNKTDPTAFLEKARSFMKKALETDKSNYELYAMSGKIDLVAARWKMLQHKTPDQEIKSALRWENEAINVSFTSNYFDGWYSKAKIYQRWVEWKLENKQNADTEIRLGLEMVSKALEINARSAEMIGTRGIFSLFQARSVDNSSQRIEFAEKAQTTLQEALKLNANLTYAFTPYLKQAESLANPSVR